MNNDVIEPSGRFARHPHDNAEIVTYITSGALEHKDSVGNGSVIKSGDLQYMSAGDGVFHSELNPSDSEKVEICQICMMPDQKGGQPMYVEKKLGKGRVKNEVKISFSNDGREGSTLIRQNATFGFGQLEERYSVSLKPDKDKPNKWVQVINGSLTLGDFQLRQADGLGIKMIDQSISINTEQNYEFFIFRLSNIV